MRDPALSRTQPPPSPDPGLAIGVARHHAQRRCRFAMKCHSIYLKAHDAGRDVETLHGVCYFKGISASGICRRVQRRTMSCQPKQKWHPPLMTGPLR